MSHTCHFHPCDKQTPRAWLYCSKHWGMVSKASQDALYAAHDKGRWIESYEGKRRYFKAVRACKADVQGLLG